MSNKKIGKKYWRLFVNKIGSFLTQNWYYFILHIKNGDETCPPKAKVSTQIYPTTSLASAGEIFRSWSRILYNSLSV